MPNALPPEKPTVGGVLSLLRRSFSSTYLQCENARFIACELPLHEAAVRRLLPLGLQPTQPCLGTFFMVDYRAPSFALPYFEAALLLHVRTPFGQGMHCCWIVVNDDTPMIYGRETLAYPKKMATITFDEQDDTTHATVTRRGQLLVDLKARTGQTLSTAPPIFGAPTYNAGGLGSWMGINPIWRFRLTETFREMHAVELELTLGASPYDPIQPLQAGPPQRARKVVADIAGAASFAPVGLAGPRWFARTYALRMH